MVIAALGGGKLDDGSDIPFVSEIVRLNGSSATFADVPDSNYSGPFVADPPSFAFQNSGLNSLHAYVEGFHDYPIALLRLGKISARDFKVTGGHLAARAGYAIAVMGDSTSIDIQLNGRSVDNPNLRGIVGIFTDDGNPAGQVISAGPLASGTRLLGDARPPGRRRSRLAPGLLGRFSDVVEKLPVD
jgi:hypothetical protein